MFGYSVWFSWSLGLEFCWVCCPLGPDPCQPRCLFCPLSFFGCLEWSPTTFFSISLSLSLYLSGAGETQTPFGVWVSPSVSSSWTRNSSSTRAPHVHLGQTQLLSVFFFVPSSSLAGMVVVGLGVSVLRLGGFLVLSVLLHCMQDTT